MISWLKDKIFSALDHRRSLKIISDSGLFDPDFYCKQSGGSITPAGALQHFVSAGIFTDRWPSAHFDPALYRRLYSDVAASGEHPLLHYIRCGRNEGRLLPDAQGRLAADIIDSGLFDPHYYLERHPEAASNGRPPIEYFMRYGLPANHAPSASFDPLAYMTLYTDVSGSGQAALAHYVNYGRLEGRLLPNEQGRLAADIIDSGLFDPHYYLERHPEATSNGRPPIEYFMRHGLPAGHDPSASFDPLTYLTLYPDVSISGQPALAHYINYGRREGRLLPDEQGRLAVDIIDSGLFDPHYYVEHHPEVASVARTPIEYFMRYGLPAGHGPSASFDPLAYLTLYPDVSGSGQSALAHYVTFGRSEGRECPPELDARSLRDELTRRSRLRGMEVKLALLEAKEYFSKYGFTFEPSGPVSRVPKAAAALASVVPAFSIDRHDPDVSIIIPVYGQTPFALACLHSLSVHRSRFSVEIIVADDMSPTEHGTAVLGSIPWIRYERSATNRGFLDNCNEAVKGANGRYVVLLNSDIWIVDGWLDELIGSFDLFPKAGYVGSKLLNGDGTLQEAGCIYWRDGTAWNYGRNGDPDDPRFNFARQVDWVSGAAIAVRHDLWIEVGGFDEAYRPAYCEDVDLAFRIRERGYEVWYQPLSRALHFEGMTHGRDETSGVKSYQVANLKRLQERWNGRLPGVRQGGEEPDREACRSVSKTMLVIDATYHRHDRDAGSVVAGEIMRAYRELGFHQIFLPTDFSYDAKYAADYQRLGVEVFHEPYFRNIQDVLRDRPDIECVLVFRYGVAQELIHTIRAIAPGARIVFSNVDLHFLRMEREASLRNDPDLTRAAAEAKTRELAVFAAVDCSLVHTEVEKDNVQLHAPAPLDNILVLPWIAQPAKSDAALEPRKHVMFLGGFPHTPNVDAVEFFVHKVWPLFVDRLPADTRFLAVGNAPPEEIQSLASDRIEVTGHVPTVEPYFASARVFVAPLRYGAGIKGKVIQSLANGVPTVATSVAAEGIGLIDGEHCLIADTPDAIAAAVLRLFAERDTWTSLRTAGLDFVEANFSAGAARALCARSLDVANETWMRRKAAACDAHVTADDRTE